MPIHGFLTIRSITWVLFQQICTADKYASELLVRTELDRIGWPYCVEWLRDTRHG